MPRHFKVRKVRPVFGRVNYGVRISPVRMINQYATPTQQEAMRIYQDYGTFALIRNLTIYALMRPRIVQNANTLLNIALKILGPRLTYFLMRETVGKVFMAGQNQQELQKSKSLYKKYHINSINDFGCEGVLKAPKEVLQNNLNNYLHTMEKAAEEKRDTIAIKITGITYLGILKDLNKPQALLQKMFTDIAGNEITAKVTKAEIKKYLQDHFNLEVTEEELDEFFRVGKTDIREIEDDDELTAVEFYSNIHAYAVYPKFESSICKKIADFSPYMQKELRELSERLIQLAEKSKKLNTGLMVDAEQTFIQASICSLTRQLQRKYNVKKAYILNTYQGYQKAALRKVMLDIQGCHMTGVSFGAKLVRGAYVTEENDLAEKQGIESPICCSAEETSLMYDACVEYIIGNIPPRSHFNVATHNSTSLSVALQAMEKNKERIKSSTISFAQLIGLGENLTFELAKKGLNSFKYMPFGPTPILAQYLLRRAEEASYISRESQKMKQEIMKELFIYRWQTWALTFGILGGSIFLKNYFKLKKSVSKV